MEDNKFITSSTTNNNLKAIVIPTDNTLGWNDIKKHKNLDFKSIDDPQLIDGYFVEHNSHYLNQSNRIPSTIEPLQCLIGSNSYTSFSENILKIEAQFNHLNLSHNIKHYLKKLKRNK